MPRTSTSARPFGTVLTAMVTPLTADGAVDLGAAVQLARHLVDHGNDGLVLNGTTGEASTTHAPEKAELVRPSSRPSATARGSSRAPGPTTPRTPCGWPSRPPRPARTGCSSSARTTRGPRRRACRRHVAAVADATDLPVMLYDVPGRTGVRFAADDHRRARRPRARRRHEGRHRRPLRRRQGHRRAPAWPGTPATTARPRAPRARRRRASSASSATSPATSWPPIGRAFDAGDHADRARHLPIDHPRDRRTQRRRLPGRRRQGRARGAGRAARAHGAPPARPRVRRRASTLIRAGLRAAGLLDLGRLTALIPPGAP